MKAPARFALAVIEHPASLVIVLGGAGALYWWLSRRERKQGPYTIDNSTGLIIDANVYDEPPEPGAVVAGSPGSTPGIPQSVYNSIRDNARNLDWTFEPGYTYKEPTVFDTVSGWFSRFAHSLNPNAV
jgi:hypothetical protein